jgi:hypothetical protein
MGLAETDSVGVVSIFARYFKQMADEAEPEIRSANQVAWVRRLSTGRS